MEILYLKSTWGMQGDLEEKLRRIRDAGFAGVELGVPADESACDHARKLLDKLELQAVVQQWTAGATPADHCASFEQQYRRAIKLAPLYVNSHTGKDFFDLDQNLLVFDRAAELERDLGLPVLHETHRGRALFSATSTTALLSRRPELKLTADFSHWCCVHESLLEDQSAAVEKAIDRSYHIHARVGHAEAPQVPDPRVPEWQPALERHFSWWQAIIARQRASGRKHMTICPEFGPPPYLVTLPGSGKPIADLWDINLFVRDYLKEKLG